MNDISNTEILTLEDLQQRRAEALEELRTQKQVMSDTARNLFAPIAPAADKGTAIMRAFNTGMAVFDGAMLGIKLIQTLTNHPITTNTPGMRAPHSLPGVFPYSDRKFLNTYCLSANYTCNSACHCNNHFQNLIPN